MAGKNTADRGRGSRDLRAVLAGQAVWLLPKRLWAFSGGEGCEPGAHFARRVVTCNHQVRRWIRWTTKINGRCQLECCVLLLTMRKTNRGKRRKQKPSQGESELGRCSGELTARVVASFSVNSVASCSRDSSVRPGRTRYARRKDRSAFHRTPLPGVGPYARPISQVQDWQG